MSQPIVIDVGHGRTIRLLPAFQGAERRFVHEHPDVRDPSRSCSCSGRLVGPSDQTPADGTTSWQLVSERPLTLAPDLRCTTCGDHGWIREGRWVPA